MRRSTVIPETIGHPFPIQCHTHVIRGFGRGSAELGIPTANVPVDEKLNSLEPGIYLGWCRLQPTSEEDASKKRMIDTDDQVPINYGNRLIGRELEVLPMVMSVGWNPFYNNEKKAAEIHVIHKFQEKFYGAEIKFVILAYVRPELNYTTKGTSRTLV